MLDVFVLKFYDEYVKIELQKRLVKLDFTEYKEMLHFQSW